MPWHLPPVGPPGRWRPAAAVAAVAAVVVLIGAVIVGVSDSARSSVRGLVVTGWRLPVGGDVPTAATLPDDHDFSEVGATEPVPPPTLHWTPAPTATWQWLPAGAPDLATAAGLVDVYDLPLATSSPQTVAAVHARGAHAICWLPVGVVSASSPHAGKVAPELLGGPVPGHPDERYLDIRQRSELTGYLEAQLDDCWTKGFDGVDAAALDTAFTPGPDGVGFPINADHQLAFARMVAGLAHARGLAVGLHSGPVDGDREQFLTAVEQVTDFAVIDRCAAAGRGCSGFAGYPESRKAVFHVEYLGDYPGATINDPGRALSRVCPIGRELGYSSILKDGSGTKPAWRASCT